MPTAADSPKLTVSPSYKTFRSSIYASRKQTQPNPKTPTTPISLFIPDDVEQDQRTHHPTPLPTPPPSPMASSSSGSTNPATSRGGGGGISAKQTTDPILRNTLRYTISAREYAVLHRYVLSRSRQLKKRVPTVETVNRIMNSGDTTSKSSSSSKEKDKGEWTVRDVGSTSAGVKAGAGAMLGADDYNARAVRHSLRVFATTAAGMKGYALIAERFMGAKKE